MRVPATERRQQLIDAAVRLTSRDGIEAANLRAIAQEANAPLSAVHYCFRDKDELMHEAVEFWLQQLVGMAEQAAIDGGLRGTLTTFADQFWHELEGDPRNILAQLEVVTWAIRGESHEDLAVSIYSRYEAALSKLFADALVSAGETSAIPPGTLARAVVGIVDAGSLQYLSDPRSGQARIVYDLLIDALLVAAGL
ncbi:MAG: TetR family transcriptional regulator [Microbacteriaceae bacterium]|nr:MAG: TetR family transcriptional regulator [Microbacteriaceae bacterium]